MISLNQSMRGLLVVPMAFLALVGCGIQGPNDSLTQTNVKTNASNGDEIDTMEKVSSQQWKITYFALNDECRATGFESTPANSVVIGQINTSEIYSRPSRNDGIPVCDIFREGQMIEKDTGRSFPIRADFRTGLFNVLASANGTTVKIRVTDKIVDESFQIHPQNVVAIEYRQ